MNEKAVLTDNLKNDENGSDKLSSIGTSPSPAEFQYKRLVPKASGMSLFISNISKHRAAFITPIVVLSIAIILMIVAFSAAEWNGVDSDKTTAKQLGESTTPAITSTKTASAPTTPTTTTTTPTTTTTTTASPTTPTTTVAPTTLTTTTVAPITSTTTTTPTTSTTTTTPTTSTTTVAPTTSTTTVAPTTTTRTTTTTSSSTTTELTSSISGIFVEVL
ncbi:hypothetical protein EB796_019966 [Bugula neritina]|uniref:Uncharacterized protein n=1 Tax=Bugula neritina TaxID=10212 RepID=A0A7J7J7J1_BUGNE|nr:hypothetical protein EB796_019966 [Bugula neritina]